MAAEEDLLLGLREHDLPPLWDGRVVLWRGWEDPEPGHVFICPPPKQRHVCEGCGSLEPWVTNRGMVAVSPSLTREELLYEEENRARLGSLAHKRKPRALWRLHAYRCPDCKLDTVWDHDTDQWWTLDFTDYGPEGSS